MPRYLIISPNWVLDRPPGMVFEDELDPVQEQRLIEGRHLQILATDPVIADNLDEDEWTSD